MPKLYLVGITEDRSGLVLAKSPRAKKGDSVIEVDHTVLDAIAEIRRYRSEGTTRPSISSPALPSRRPTAGEVSTPSALSPREIQSRLRRGESIQSVARRAGVEHWRIEVYAAPIAAEQARVVARARDLIMVKRGAGASGRSLGESVQANIVEKRVSMNADEFESAWSAYEPEPDRWVVTFEYLSRGARQRAEWLYEDDLITPHNRAATTLGWRDPRRTGKLPPLPEAPRPAPAKAPSKRRPVPRKSLARKPATKPSKKPATKPVKKRAAPKRQAASTKRASGKKPAKTRATTKKRPAPKKKPAKTRAAAAKQAQPRHLRIVEPPAEPRPAEQTSLAPARSWREQAQRIEPPSWVQRAPASEPTRRVAVDAARVTPRRRSLRRRERPLRPN